MIPISDQWLHSGILLAVSGGADSVALLRLFAEKQFDASRVAVAHVNHGTRGGESDEDARFVKKLSEQWHFSYFEQKLSANAIDQTHCGSWEEAARDLRYAFFRQTAEKLGYRYIATAHTQDDQVETILFRILRGTGLAGLAGIRKFRQINDAITLVHPLLEVDKRAILDYLKGLGQDFRTDSSNISTDFMRNKIRNQLLPLLKKDYGFSVDLSLLRLGKQAETWADHFLKETEALFEQTVEFLEHHGVEIHVSKLRDLPPPLIAEVLKLVWKKKNWPLQNMGFEQWNFLSRVLVEGISMKKVFPGTIMVEYDARSEVMNIKQLSQNNS